MTVPEVSFLKTKTNKNITGGGGGGAGRQHLSEKVLSLPDFSRAFVQHWRNRLRHQQPELLPYKMASPTCTPRLGLRHETGSGFRPRGFGWVRAGGHRGSRSSAWSAAGVRVGSRAAGKWAGAPSLGGRRGFSPGLCEWRRRFSVRIEERAQDAGDVTVRGGEWLRGPRCPRATWPCPSPRLPRRWRGQFSTQVRREGCHLDRWLPVAFRGRLLGPASALFKEYLPNLPGFLT